MHKKILAVLAVFSALLLPQSRANDIEPTKEFYTAIHKGAAPMVIDGNLTEWTGVPVLSDPKFSIPKGSGPGGAVKATCAQCSDDVASPNYVLWESLGGTWTGPDDQTSAVEVVWDADNVYLGFIVTDDYHENAANSAWNGDSVQLMITKEDRAGSAGSGFFLYNFALGGTEDALNDPDTQTIAELETPAPGADATDVSAIVRRDTVNKKTTYEIRLSARAMGLAPNSLTAGTKFGLGMAINDGDQAEPGQKGWGGLGAHSIVYQKTPSETALVTLSGALPGQDLIFLSAVNPQISGFSFRVTDKGTSISDPATAKLTINGTQVTLTPSAKNNGVVDFTYTATTPFAPGSVNNYAIEVKDTGGQTLSDSGSFTTPSYAIVKAADKRTPDTTKRGFVFKIHQNTPLNINTYDRAIKQLAGVLGENFADPNAQGPALAPATPNTPETKNLPITFEVETVINMDGLSGGGVIGSATATDDNMPGLPGTGASLQAEGVAADIITYVTLTKGLHTLIVNSDDGFRSFVGNIFDVSAKRLAGAFDGGRGAADSPFVVLAEEDGVYGLRTIFEQGGGGVNIEILEQLPTGAKVLLNDDANGGPITYRVAAGEPTALTSFLPIDGSTGVNGGGAISATISEGAQTVDMNSIVLKVDGNTVNATKNKVGNVITVSFTPNPALSANANHTASISFTAGTATVTANSAFKTTLFGPGTLFIEAEDFNFGHGQYDTVNAIGMTGAYPGGTYQDKGDGLSGAACDGTDFGIDYNDNNNTSDQAVYRPNTPVEAGKLNGPAGFDRGTFQVSVNHVIGWTGTDEWMNYTRDFPTTGITTYNVYARMAHGDATAGVTRGGILMKVAGDPTKCANTDQTTTELGRFSAPWTGGWDTWPDAGTPADALIPMKDSAGNLSVIRITGKQTLRFQYAGSAGDFDFLAFVPVDVPLLPPTVLSTFPQPGLPIGDSPVFQAVLEKRDLDVTSASLTLDGTSVPVTFTKTATGATVKAASTQKLTAGSSHTWVLSYTDDGTPAVTRTASIPFKISFTPLPAGTLFVEAEDFNFGHGQYDTVNAIGMTGAYPGGTYQGKGDGLNGAACDGSDFGIDYNDSNATSDAAAYRPTTPIEAGKRNGSAGLNRHTFEVQVNHVIGWTGGDEWQNYTRDFPTTGTTTYRVYARMAHGDGGVDIKRGGILWKVSGDVTQCSDPNQTTEQLGTFSAPWTGGWDTFPDAGTPQDALIPMLDANGKVAVVAISGKQTLRFQYALNAGDFDYLAFVPQAGPTPPILVSMTPSAGLTFAHVSQAFTAVLEDQQSTVTGATLKLNGASVTPTVTRNGTTTTVTFKPTTPLPSGAASTYSLTFTDSNGGSQSAETTFTTTFTGLPDGTLFIEAEDFNFGHGQYDTANPIGMTGVYAGGTYQDKGDGLAGADCDGTDFGIDYHDNNSGSDQAVYRPNTPVEAGKLNGPAGFNRGGFSVQVNHVIGWTDSSEWMNYTRDFPTPAQKYRVFARMAHGDAASSRGGILWLVAGDPTQCASGNQTTTELGRFSAPWTGGWDTWPDAGTTQDALIPMKSGGAIAEVTLGGKQTVRFQYDLQAGDIDYLAFVPSGGVVVPPPNFTKVQVNANGSITVEWTGAAVLETTPALTPNPTWTPINGATSPFTFTPQAGVPMLFGRLRATSP